MVYDWDNRSSLAVSSIFCRLHDWDGHCWDCWRLKSRIFLILPDKELDQKLSDLGFQWKTLNLEWDLQQTAQEKSIISLPQPVPPKK
jgi:hypothetical protein